MKEKDTTPEVTLVPTTDGSLTLLHRAYNQTYHSVHGALQEARHVFLEQGLHYWLAHAERNPESPVRVLEVGFGAGLNFLVTAAYCMRSGIHLEYTGVEPFPVAKSVVEGSHYARLLEDQTQQNAYLNWYPGPEPLELQPGVRIQLLQRPILEITELPPSDLVYFDAFAPTTQPEMWSPEVIRHATASLPTGGLFVSYSITGNLKRALKNLGFAVEKPKGAAGKREMIRAIRL